MSSVVPEGWKLSPLGDIASVNWGNTSLTKNNYTEIGFPAFSAAGNDGLVSNAEHTSTGVVLSAIGARCGRTFLTPQKWTAIKNTITILSDDQDIRFLYQVFNFDEVWNKSGGAQPFISLGDARKTLILHPPLPEQKKIASILTSVDEVIKNTQKQIDKLQDLKKATMNELLTKGIGHTEFKDSELGRIPKSWECNNLGNVISDIKGGGTPSRLDFTYWDGGIPWATVKDLKKIRLSQTEELISEKGLQNSSSNLITKRTVIIATRMGLGKAVIFDKDVAINQDLKALFPSDHLDSEYLLYWFLSKSDEIEKLGTGSTVKGIRLEVLKSILFLTPPIKEQKKIVSVLNSIEECEQSINAKLYQVQSLKKSLMQDLLTGKVRVTVS